MALTYSTLQTQIASFLNRDDLTAQIPTFIELAEANLNRDLRHWQMEKRSEAAFDERYEPFPSDLITLRRVSISGKKQIDLISQAKMFEFRNANDDTAGEPRYYAISAGQIEFYPTPDASYPGSIIYQGRIPPLTDGEPTNWLLLDSPDIYIYGALVHTAPYLQEDPRLQTWASLYSSAVQRLNEASDEATYGGSGLTMR